MDVANEILDAIEIIVDKKIRENTVQIYPGVCKSVSGNSCVMSINGRDNTVQFYGSTPTVGTIYRVFVPNGNMSMAFIIAINDDSSSAKSASIFVTGLSETDSVKATHKIPGQVVNPEWKSLPDGYTQLEYIESTGTQYIHLASVYASSPVDMKLHVSNFNGGYIVGQSSNGYGGRLSNNLYRPFGRTDYQFLNLPISSNKEHHIELGYDYIIIDGISYSGSSDRGNTVSGEVTLFAGNDASGKQYASGRIHYAEATQGDFHCVMYAVRRNADGALGLYDTIHGVFYTNSGSGLFLAGSEVPQYIDGYVDGKTIVGKWTQIPNPAIVVPAGYTQLEYIESAGTQYIDTGYKPKTTTTVKTRFYSEPYTSFDCPFGCRTASQSKAFLLFTRCDGASKSAFDHGNSENWIATDNMYNKWLDVSTDASHLYMRENNNLLYTLTFNGTAQDTEYNLFLFNLNEKGSIYSGNICATKCKMSYFQAYENDTLVRNLIPCKRNSDSAVGMYDLVTNEFFGSSGTGTFTAGVGVPHTIGGFLIDKIKDYGTWTVTATDGEQTATQDVLVDTITEYEIEMDYNA